VREESHLEDMRSAIRGDFERLAERRGEQVLMRVDEAPSEPQPEADEPDEPETEDALDQQPEAAPDPDPEPDGHHELVAEDGLERQPEPEEGAEPRRSWLARFLSP
jgi:hypothetical protein